ncbi:MAG: hypothetical protein OXE45_09430 [bacterium]|nr:hypothetical protein [bacterium]
MDNWPATARLAAVAAAGQLPTATNGRQNSYTTPGDTTGDWHALRSNPDYKVDWRADGGAPAVVDSAGFALRAQTEADLDAARWGLFAWEDPRERSRFKLFWIDEGMLGAKLVEPGDLWRFLETFPRGCRAAGRRTTSA